jgi:hypothetical protein
MAPKWEYQVRRAVLAVPESRRSQGYLDWGDEAAEDLANRAGREGWEIFNLDWSIQRGSGKKCPLYIVVSYQTKRPIVHAEAAMEGSADDDSR